MENELKQNFARRLSQCNRGEMIVIIYEIYFAYETDLIQAHQDGDYEKFKNCLRRAQDTIGKLMDSLDFSYEISEQLYALYRYCRQQLAKALYQNRLTGISDAHRIMERLYQSFIKAAEQDHSPPLMSNTQQVYAGMTYGRNDLNENFIEDHHRGFFA